MTKPLNWGILATGNIARVFATALGQRTDNRLAAFASRSQAGADRFAGDFPDATAYPAYADLIADPEVEAIYIAGPHPDHVAWTIRALVAGKHVLCEKPMGMNHAEVMAMTHAARRNNRFLMEAFMYRCHPQTLALMDTLNSGAIGELRMIDAEFGFAAPFDAGSRLFARELGGGGILDVGCYPASLARLVTGAEPEDVKGVGELGASGVDERASALLRFPGGVIARLSTAISTRLDSGVTLYGSKGSIRIDRPWHCSDAQGNWHFSLSNKDGTRTVEGRTEGLIYGYEIDEVARCIRSGKLMSPRMSWQDSLGNAQTLDRWRTQIGLAYDGETRASVPVAVPATAAEPTLVRRTLPGLEKPISQLVMGCDNQPGISHAARMWDYFVERGGNAFDTAWIYGLGAMEKLLGAWQEARGVREEIVIVGKGAHTPDCWPDKIVTQLDKSLQRLRTDYVDLYLMHRDNLEVPVGEFVDALNAQQSAGRARLIGVSNWTLPRILEANEYAAANGLNGVQAISNNFSLARMINALWPGVESASDPTFVDFLRDSGTTLLPWSSQARGFFTPWADQVRAAQESVQPGAMTEAEPTATELRDTWFSEDNFARRDRAVVLAEQRRIPLINVALAYVASQPFPCLPLVGARQLHEIDSCIEGAGIRLSEAELHWLETGER